MEDTEPDICAFKEAETYCNGDSRGTKRSWAVRKTQRESRKSSSLMVTKRERSRKSQLDVATRPSAHSIVKLLVLIIGYLPVIHGYPVMSLSSVPEDGGNFRKDPEEVDFWFDMMVSAVLVLLGGLFAGLTLGLMGQDEINLEVIKQSGELFERRQADKVLRVLNKGKHWVLVTLLLSNVITNETLPIVLDRCLGGGWPAVVSSTVAIVIFGEIIPQSICVRHGLAVGATCAPFVMGLMYLMYPVAYPIALLLDRILGEDHGTVYKKAGLKTFVTLHKNIGVERLNEDEVTIISAVLDLKEKPVRNIMTPMEDVFVMSADTILDEPTMEMILHTGFNRIPIHAPGEPTNFVGMLLVRILITYDPEDALPITAFPLATLPETGPDTSCLNILNYFQEGKSHMIIVSESPGEPHGAIGVLTLEDVIEELIGEEIIDESDVYVDVHKAIRRAQPGPLAKRQMNFENALSALTSSESTTNHATSPPAGTNGGLLPTLPKLGPLNKASNPLTPSTRNITVKPATKLLSGSPKKSGMLIGDPNDVGRPSGHPTTNLDPHGHHNADDLLLATKSGQNIAYTEGGAVKEALVNSRLTKHLVTSASDLFGDLTAEERTMSPALSESHSYRTGGIIESVVNVDGVSKVIIEDESTDERRKHSQSSEDEQVSLLSHAQTDGSSTDHDKEVIVNGGNGTANSTPALEAVHVIRRDNKTKNKKKKKAKRNH